MAGTALVDIKERIKADMLRIRNTVPATAGRVISTKGKIFTLPTGQTSPGPLQAVILDWRNFNAYYRTPYNAQKPSPPDCFALGMEIPELVPHDLSKEKQSPGCAVCQWNKFGSAVGGGKGKACRNMVRLAIAAPDATVDSEPMVLKISPTGLTRWAGLINTFDTIGKHPMEHVTEIGFDANQSYPTLTFKEGPPVETLETFWFLREKAQILLDATPQVNE